MGREAARNVAAALHIDQRAVALMGTSDSPLETLRRVREERVSEARHALTAANLLVCEATKALTLERAHHATLEQERASLELAPGSRLRVSELAKLETRRAEIEKAVALSLSRAHSAELAVERATQEVDAAEKAVVQALAERQVVDATIDERARVKRMQDDEREDEDILDGIRARTAS